MGSEKYCDDTKVAGPPTRGLTVGCDGVGDKWVDKAHPPAYTWRGSKTGGGIGGRGQDVGGGIGGDGHEQDDTVVETGHDSDE